jgi:membrane protein
LSNLLHNKTQLLTNSVISRAIIGWSKRTSLPGFLRIPIYDVVGFVWKEWRSSVMDTRANAIAFSFFLSLFPSIIVLFTLLAYTPFADEFYNLLKDTIKDLMPENAEKFFITTINDILKIKRSGLLSFSFLLAMYFSTNGMSMMLTGFEKSYKETFMRPNFFRKRWTAIKLTALLGLLLLFSVIFGIMGDVLVETISKIYKSKAIYKGLLTASRILLLVILLYGGLSIIYRVGMPLRKKLPIVNPGVTLATLLSLLTSYFFSFYVDNFGSYNTVYGSIGALIVLLLWLQINIYIVLIGFELNASIAIIRDRATIAKDYE